MSEENQSRLARHLALARELGAEIVTTTDDDIVRGILRIAREQNATQIVVGKPAGWRVVDLLRGGSMLNRLIRDSDRIDIHAVRAEGETAPRGQYAPPVLKRPICAATPSPPASWRGDRVERRSATVARLSGRGAGLFVERGGAGIVRRARRTLAAATLTALLWNFIFTEPRFTFRISNAADAMMFAMYFVVAVVMGQLAARLRAQQTAERLREQRATALYLLTRELAKRRTWRNCWPS